MNTRSTMEGVGSSTNLINWDPVRISHTKPFFKQEEVASLVGEDVWNKFILFGVGEHGLREVLEKIITVCEPEIIIPVAYKAEDINKSTFIAKCTVKTIESLVKQDLKVHLSNGNAVCIDIVMGYLGVQELQLNPNRIIAQTICNRYESAKKILNLDDFEKDKSLGPVFCPLSMPRILNFVLRCTRVGILANNWDVRLTVRELSLKYNKLTNIILFEKFFNYHLTKLDIRHNEICDIGNLQYFSEFKISEVWLDGNPLCDNYRTSQEYVQAVKNVFPHLQKLDGVVIGMEQKFVPAIQANYLGDGTKSSIIKQFVKHYFTLYDQEDRIIMNGLYDRDAFYSMTLGPMTNYVHKQITKSFGANRNLLKFVDYAKCQEFLLQGPEKIINALCRQPPTIHYFKTFHVDLLHQGADHIAFAVQGVFMYRELSCPPMLFNRTFVVTKKEDNEYCIINDQYYLDGTPVHTDVRLCNKPLPRYEPTVLGNSEREQLLIFLQELTTMNTTFCREYLEEAKWDIRVAITAFMKKYTVNDISPDAFH